MTKEMDLILLLFEGHDLYSSKHSQKTSLLAEKLGKELSISNQNLSLLKTGALLHDIGKLMLPHDVLNKPAKLDTVEKEIVKEHTEIGANLLKDAEYDKKIIEIVKYHHEWWNGTGYPAGLKEDEIPLMAQIVAIASSYDVMTSPKIYTSLKSREEALEELNEYKGIQFSPKLVEKFIKIINEDKR